MEVRRVATFRDGPINAQILGFDGTEKLGFVLWRWTMDKSKKSTATLRRANVPSLLLILERVSEALGSMPAVDPSAKVRTLNSRTIDSETWLHSRRYDDVLLTVHAGKREPWFQIRRLTTEELTTTENWFFENHLEKIRLAITEAGRWLSEATPLP